MTDYSPGAPVAARKWAAITAFVTGLLGLLLTIVFFATDVGSSFLIFGALLGVAGVVFGIIALVKKQSRGLAIAGLIVGAFTSLGALALFIFALLFVGAFITALG